MKVVCISGHARHGKDTTAEILRNVLWSRGKRVLVTHYADLLKFMCKQLFAWDGIKDEHGRHILQYVGTDIIRAQYPDFWVDFIIQELQLFKDHWDFVLIPDCRFPNEVDRLREEGYEAVLLKVIRSDMQNGSADEQLTDQQKAHISETAMDHVVPDYLIENTGTLVDLTDAVLHFVSFLCGGDFLNGGE